MSQKKICRVPLLDYEATLGVTPSGLHFGASSVCGFRRHMEDQCVHCPSLPFHTKASDQSSISVFAVFDGHAGDGASSFAASNFVSVLLESERVRRKQDQQQKQRHSHHFLSTDVSSQAQTSSSDEEDDVVHQAGTAQKIPFCMDSIPALTGDVVQDPKSIRSDVPFSDDEFLRRAFVTLDERLRFELVQKFDESLRRNGLGSFGRAAEVKSPGSTCVSCLILSNGIEGNVPLVTPAKMQVEEEEEEEEEEGEGEVVVADRFAQLGITDELLENFDETLRITKEMSLRSADVIREPWKKVVDLHQRLVMLANKLRDLLSDEAKATRENEGRTQRIHVRLIQWGGTMIRVVLNGETERQCELRDMQERTHDVQMELEEISIHLKIVHGMFDKLRAVFRVRRELGALLRHFPNPTLRKVPFVSDRETTTVSRTSSRTHEIVCCNLGDSRAVLFCGSHTIRLTSDHSLSASFEMDRIHSAGGCYQQGSYLYSQTCTSNGVNMTRCLGDFGLKLGDADLPVHLRGFSAVPAVQRCRLTRTNDGMWEVDEGIRIPRVKGEENHPFTFLVIACDGLFEDMTIAKVRNFVFKRLGLVARGSYATFRRSQAGNLKKILSRERIRACFAGQSLEKRIIDLEGFGRGSLAVGDAVNSIALPRVGSVVEAQYDRPEAPWCLDYIAEDLVSEAVRLGSHDNVSCTIILFPNRSVNKAEVVKDRGESRSDPNEPSEVKAAEQEEVGDSGGGEDSELTCCSRDSTV